MHSKIVMSPKFQTIRQFQDFSNSILNLPFDLIDTANLSWVNKNDLNVRNSYLTISLRKA